MRHRRPKIEDWVDCFSDRWVSWKTIYEGGQSAWDARRWSDALVDNSWIEDERHWIRLMKEWWTIANQYSVSVNFPDVFRCFWDMRVFLHWHAHWSVAMQTVPRHLPVLKLCARGYVPLVCLSLMRASLLRWRSTLRTLTCVLIN